MRCRQPIFATVQVQMCRSELVRRLAEHARHALQPRRARRLHPSRIGTANAGTELSADADADGLPYSQPDSQPDGQPDGQSDGQPQP